MKALRKIKSCEVSNAGLIGDCAGCCSTSGGAEGALVANARKGVYAVGTGKLGRIGCRFEDKAATGTSNVGRAQAVVTGKR